MRIIGTTRAIQELHTPIGNETCFWFKTKVGRPNIGTATFKSSALILYYIDCVNGPVLIDPLMLAINDLFWQKSSASEFAIAIAIAIAIA